MSEKPKLSTEDFIRDLGLDEFVEPEPETEDKFSRKLLIIEATAVLKKELEDIEDQACKILERKERVDGLLNDLARLCREL